MGLRLYGFSAGVGHALSHPGSLFVQACPTAARFCGPMAAKAAAVGDGSAVLLQRRPRLPPAAGDLRADAGAVC